MPVRPGVAGGRAGAAAGLGLDRRAQAQSPWLRAGSRAARWPRARAPAGPRGASSVPGRLKFCSSRGPTASVAGVLRRRRRLGRALGKRRRRAEPERQPPPTYSLKRKPALISSRSVLESPSFSGGARSPCPPRARTSSTGSMNRAGTQRFALTRVDQHQLAIVLGVDLDPALAGDRDAVARAGLDAVHPDAAARHEIEVPARIGDRWRSTSPALTVAPSTARRR